MHTQPGRWPEISGSGRFASLIRRETAEEHAVGLIGLPDDHGVRLNNGRPGAARGPDAFRRALAGYGSARPDGLAWPAVVDVGDVRPAGDDLHATHERVTEAVGAVVDAGLFPVAIGGGHDLTYPVVRAVHARTGLDAGVYFDAHLDVREQDGSGMPFRRIVEDCGIGTLHVHGLDRLANSDEHVRWFGSHGGRIDAFGAEGDWPDGDLFVSLDLDVIDQAHAPGVSAGNPCGWTPGQAERWVRAAGRRERVRCFDIMELSPEHDASGRTARLAARLFLAFLAGYAERRR